MNKNDEDFIDGKHEQKKNPFRYLKARIIDLFFKQTSRKSQVSAQPVKKVLYFEYIFLFFPDK